MTGNKLVVSFDPDTLLDNGQSTRIWNYFEFREFIKQLQLKTDQIDLYMITTSSDSDFIAKTIINLDIDSAKVLQVSSISGKITQLNNYSVDIHLDGDQLTCDSIEQLATTAVSIPVNFIICTQNREAKWLDRFKFWYKQITKKEVEFTT